MDRRTTGIVITIATSILCGLPGLVCLCVGLWSAALSLDPAWIEGFSGDVPARSVTIVVLSNACIGVLLIATPIIVAIIYFRRRITRPVLASDEPLPPPS